MWCAGDSERWWWRWLHGWQKTRGREMNEEESDGYLLFEAKAAEATIQIVWYSPPLCLKYRGSSILNMGNGMCFLHHTTVTVTIATFSTPQFTSSFGAFAIFALGWCDRCRWTLIIMGTCIVVVLYTLLCNSIRSNISLTMFSEYFSSISSSNGSFSSR